MAAHRLVVGTGALVALASAAFVATADPDVAVPGSYDLTGTQGSEATTVKLTVGEGGDVTRVATLAGRTETLTGSGRFATPLRLEVTFATPTDDSSDVPDPTDLAGSWDLKGRNGVGPYTGSGSFEKTPTGWRATFAYTYDNGRGQGGLQLTGALDGSTFEGKRLRTSGLVGALSGSGSRPPFPISYALSEDGLTLGGSYGPGNAFSESFTRGKASSRGPGAITGIYTFDGQGAVHGTLKNTTRKGGWTHAAESGKKEDEKCGITSPAAGSSLLVGQILDVTVTPAKATWDVASGPGNKTATGKLQVTGEGDLVLVASLRGKQSDPITVKAEKAEVCEITVQGAQPIQDAPPPHMKRALGATDAPALQPAAILLGEKLTVKATLQAKEDLGVPATITLAASSGGAHLVGQATISSLKAGEAVTLTSDSALSGVIDVNALDLEWSIEAEGQKTVLAPTTALRVYTSYKPPVINGFRGTVATKDHLEKVCTWAKGTSKNVANGPDSICWKLDNMVRHHVHPVDFKPGKIPFTCAYPFDSKTPPLNYGDLPKAEETARTGERPIEGALYYPPLDGEIKSALEREPRKASEIHAKQDYVHFASNFGWWVLDNPTHPGGRCNQQASLMCDLFGTIGIHAHVHYVHRVGISNSGRGVTQYFNSLPNEFYWNFHGLAQATLEDGTQWLYDGSFSYAPNRKNGSIEWSEDVGHWDGKHWTNDNQPPYIWEFGYWKYDDSNELVPDKDIPRTHVDGDDPRVGEFVGVPPAPNEKLDWYNHAGRYNKNRSVKQPNLPND